MPTYQRKREATVEAAQFTKEHGAQILEVGHLPPGLFARVRPRTPEGGGFELNGTPIAFGDYVIAGPKGSIEAILSQGAFEALYELAAPTNERRQLPQGERQAPARQPDPALVSRGGQQPRGGQVRRGGVANALPTTPTAPTDPAPASVTAPATEGHVEPAILVPTTEAPAAPTGKLPTQDDFT